jgi:hypothetical protein
MKKLFVLGLMLMSSNIFANEIIEKRKTGSNELLVERCCRRTASDENGNTWTARRCFDHPDGAQAMGAACALAQADADKMKEDATKDTSIE